MAIDEVKLMRDRARGQRVQQFLQGEDAKPCLRALEQEYFKKWAATQPHEVQTREEIYRLMLALGDMTRHLVSVAGAGKLAQRTFDEIEEAARRRDMRSA